ncbi:MAG: hypothetical protein Q9227_000665 [Pyrenula ochraceoflavens]
MAAHLSAPPVLSTPDTHIFSEITPNITQPTIQASDEVLIAKYEIERTLHEIRSRKWQRIALQFPDEMLPDAPRVFRLLSRGIEAELPMDIPRSNEESKDQESNAQKAFAQRDQISNSAATSTTEPPSPPLAKDMTNLSLTPTSSALASLPKFFILADTSYSPCCVDEIAAEHVSADSVVHYGRACLSPTSRLPVLHIFTSNTLDHDNVVEAFVQTFPDKQGDGVIVMADVPYAEHVDSVVRRLRETAGYENVLSTEVARDPQAEIPNRRVIGLGSYPAARESQSAEEQSQQQQHEEGPLKQHSIFHISHPPTALLLTLASRVKSIHIYSTSKKPAPATSELVTSTASLLRRRYALLTSLSAVHIWGVLVNTLSVTRYRESITAIRTLIESSPGRKAYTFVVGKLNAAKLANFAEIGGWVVVGCWESSLVDSKEFFKPVITPFELQICLQGDRGRVWTGEWRGGLDGLQLGNDEAGETSHGGPEGDGNGNDGEDDGEEQHDFDSEPESAPPEFDLRTGKYVSQSRPVQPRKSPSYAAHSPETALKKRAKGDVASIRGAVSPAADFLRQKRTWQGLGSDFEIKYEEDGGEEEEGGLMKEGRKGVARGYVVGDGEGQEWR